MVALTRPVLLSERVVEGKRLGWHRHHDERSRTFNVADWLDLTKPIKGKTWAGLDAPLDQGQIGSCTGNAATYLCATAPLVKAGVYYDEALALKLYELATRLDGVPGEYPPNDTGSTTVAVLKAAQRLGLIAAYLWSFDFDHTLHALDQIGALIVGVRWHKSFDVPTSSGLLELHGGDRGGHEICLHTIRPDRRYGGGGWVEGYQSWGNLGAPWIGGWRFRWSWATLKRLLIDEQGEVGIGLSPGA